MKILTPVSEVPSSKHNSSSKFDPILEQLNKIKINQFLPVQFEDERKAESFRNCMIRKELIAKRRGNIVYLLRGARDK